MNRSLIRIPVTSLPVVTTGGLALSDSKKGEALTDIPKVPFLPVKELSEPAVIEVVDRTMKAYFCSPV
jgi:hypothetical protein